MFEAIKGKKRDAMGAEGRRKAGGGRRRARQGRAGIGRDAHGDAIKAGGETVAS